MPAGIEKGNQVSQNRITRESITRNSSVSAVYQTLVNQDKLIESEMLNKLTGKFTEFERKDGKSLFPIAISERLQVLLKRLEEQKDGNQWVALLFQLNLEYKTLMALGVKEYVVCFKKLLQEFSKIVFPNASNVNFLVEILENESYVRKINERNLASQTYGKHNAFLINSLYPFIADYFRTVSYQGLSNEAIEKQAKFEKNLLAIIPIVLNNRPAVEIAGQITLALGTAPDFQIILALQERLDYVKENLLIGSEEEIVRQKNAINEQLEVNYIKKLETGIKRKCGHSDVFPKIDENSIQKDSKSTAEYWSDFIRKYRDIIPDVKEKQSKKQLRKSFNALTDAVTKLDLPCRDLCKVFSQLPNSPKKAALSSQLQADFVTQNLEDQIYLFDAIVSYNAGEDRIDQFAKRAAGVISFKLKNVETLNSGNLQQQFSNAVTKHKEIIKKRSSGFLGLFTSWWYKKYDIELNKLDKIAQVRESFESIEIPVPPQIGKNIDDLGDANFELKLNAKIQHAQLATIDKIVTKLAPDIVEYLDLKTAPHPADKLKLIEEKLEWLKEKIQGVEEKVAPAIKHCNDQIAWLTEQKQILADEEIKHVYINLVCNLTRSAIGDAAVGSKKAHVENSQVGLVAKYIAMGSTLLPILKPVGVIAGIVQGADQASRKSQSEKLSGQELCYTDAENRSHLVARMVVRAFGAEIKGLDEKSKKQFAIDVFQKVHILIESETVFIDPADYIKSAENIFAGLQEPLKNASTVIKLQNMFGGYFKKLQTKDGTIITVDDILTGAFKAHNKKVEAQPYNSISSSPTKGLFAGANSNYLVPTVKAHDEALKNQQTYLNKLEQEIKSLKEQVGQVKQSEQKLQERVEQLEQKNQQLANELAQIQQPVRTLEQLTNPGASVISQISEPASNSDKIVVDVKTETTNKPVEVLPIQANDSIPVKNSSAAIERDRHKSRSFNPAEIRKALADVSEPQPKKVLADVPKPQPTDNYRWAYRAMYYSKELVDVVKNFHTQAQKFTVKDENEGGLIRLKPFMTNDQYRKIAALSPQFNKFVWKNSLFLRLEGAVKDLDGCRFLRITNGSEIPNEKNVYVFNEKISEVYYITPYGQTENIVIEDIERFKKLFNKFMVNKTENDKEEATNDKYLSNLNIEELFIYRSRFLKITNGSEIPNEKNVYVFNEKTSEVYYITAHGQNENIVIEDIEKFKRSFYELMDNENDKYLSNSDVEKLLAGGKRLILEAHNRFDESNYSEEHKYFAKKIAAFIFTLKQIILGAMGFRQHLEDLAKMIVTTVPLLSEKFQYDESKSKSELSIKFRHDFKKQSPDLYVGSIIISPTQILTRYMLPINEMIKHIPKEFVLDESGKNFLNELIELLKLLNTMVPKLELKETGIKETGILDKWLAVIGGAFSSKQDSKLDSPNRKSQVPQPRNYYKRMTFLQGNSPENIQELKKQHSGANLLQEFQKPAGQAATPVPKNVLK